jgi:glutaryl-CoA dehydrogenase
VFRPDRTRRRQRPGRHEDPREKRRQGLVLTDVRVPEENVLPDAEGLRGPLSCLTQARFGISFGALGAARACFDSVLAYSRERTAFGTPIAQKQLVQHKLVQMAMEIAKGKLLSLHFGRIKEKRDLLPAQVSLCKKNNVGIALEIARSARSLLAGNGILLEYPVIRHMLNLESVFTYEGTDEVHTLILGQTLTGHSAF